jgi:hypothetical protein
MRLQFTKRTSLIKIYASLANPFENERFGNPWECTEVARPSVNQIELVMREKHAWWRLKMHRQLRQAGMLRCNDAATTSCEKFRISEELRVWPIDPITQRRWKRLNHSYKKFLRSKTIHPPS